MLTICTAYVLDLRGRFPQSTLIAPSSWSREVHWRERALALEVELTETRAKGENERASMLRY